MPSALTDQEARSAAFRETAALRANAKAQQKALALKLHRDGEPHHLIMSRCDISRPTLVSWLREAGLGGGSARPVVMAVGVPAEPISSMSVEPTPLRVFGQWG